MKQLTTIVALFLLSLPIFATNPNFSSPEDRCRKIIEAGLETLHLAQKVEMDLLNGAWKFRADQISSLTPSTSKATIQFYDYGMADVFSKDASGAQTVKSYLWQIKVENNQPILTLSDDFAKPDYAFRLEQTCEGINLYDAQSGMKTSLVYTTPKSPRSKQEIQFSLIGSWKSMQYPFDVTKDLNCCGTFETMKDAYLKYEFFEDGSYVKNLGTAKMDIEERGFWEISPDGKNVIFHATVKGNPEEVYATYVAEISHVNLGEMVLKQALKGAGDFDTLFCTKNKAFFFNRS